MSISTKVRRPAAVDVAFWLWIASAFLLILFGLINVSSASYALREQFADQGVASANIDIYVTFVRISGCVFLLTGLAVGALAYPTRSGKASIRRGLVIVSAIFAVAQTALVIAGISTSLALVVPVMMMCACAAIYRETTRSWFAGA